MRYLWKGEIAKDNSTLIIFVQDCDAQKYYLRNISSQSKVINQGSSLGVKGSFVAASDKDFSLLMRAEDMFED